MGNGGADWAAVESARSIEPRTKRLRDRRHHHHRPHHPQQKGEPEAPHGTRYARPWVARPATRKEGPWCRAAHKRMSMTGVGLEPVPFRVA